MLRSALSLFLSISVVGTAACTRDFDLPQQGGELTVGEDGLTIAPLESVQLTVGGSEGPFTFSFLQVGTGDPTLDENTGAYQAGAIGGGRDIIEVTDGGGAVGRAELRTGAALNLSQQRILLHAGARTSFDFSGGKAPYTVHLEPDATAPVIDDRPWIGEAELFCDAIGAPDPCDATADLSLLSEGELWYRAAQPMPRHAGDGQEVGYRVIDGDTERCTLDGVDWGLRVDLVTVTDAVGTSVTIELSSGDPLTAVLDSWTVHAGERRQVVPSGGTDPYRYVLPFNRSGGTLDEHNGAYRPGYAANALDGLLVVDAGGAYCFFEALVRGQRHPTGHVTHAVLADLDGDGVDDLVAADGDAARPSLWVGTNRPFAAAEVRRFSPEYTLLPRHVIRGLNSGRDLILADEPHPVAICSGRLTNTMVLSADFGGNLGEPQRLMSLPVEGVAWDRVSGRPILAHRECGPSSMEIRLSTLSSDGSGGWQLTLLQTNPTTDLPAVGDFDGDGQVDLAALDPTAGRLRVAWGPGLDLTDPGTTVIDLKASFLAWEVDLQTGDLDGDGATDLVVADEVQGLLYPLYGSWDHAAIVPPTEVSVSRQAEEGRLAWWLVQDDRIAAIFYRDGSELMEYRGWQGGWDGPRPAFYRNDLGFRPVDLAVGDVNGDGAPDVVPVGGSLTSPVFLGSGEGSFGWRLRYGPGVPGGTARGWFPADDGIDREDDLLTVEGNVLRVWAGTSSALTLAADYDAGRSGELIGLHDVDGDGRDDALRYAPGSLFAQLGLDGAYDTYATHFEDVPMASRARLADFDGDGAGETLVFTGGEVEVATADVAGLDPLAAGLVLLEQGYPVAGQCEIELVVEVTSARHLLTAVCGSGGFWSVHVGAPDASGVVAWNSWGSVMGLFDATLTVHALYQGRLVLGPTTLPDLNGMLLLDSSGGVEPIWTDGAVITGALVRDLNGDGSPELLVGTEKESLFIFRNLAGAMTIVGGASIPGRPWGWMVLNYQAPDPHLVVENGREVLLLAPEELAVP